jgi:ABC-type polysaccharide/polyol phosphate export permease
MSSSSEVLAETLTGAPDSGQSLLTRLWESRGLLANLVKRDIKVKYKESFLGFFWSFAKPLFLMIIMAVVFSALMNVRLNNPLVPYPLHLLVSLVPWFLLANGLGDALHSIVVNGNLIKKVRVTAEVFPLSAILSNTVHFAISMVVLLGFLLWYGFWIDLPIILLPVALGLQLILMVGLALLLSSLNVVFRDVASIYEVFVAGWFYATPIIYDYTFFESFVSRPEHAHYAWARWVFALNPMVGIEAAYRRALIYSGPRAQNAGIEMSNHQLLTHLIFSLVISLLILWVGIVVFRRLSRTFADRL